MERVIFLDRDGTLNEEVNYLHRKEDLRILDGVFEALRLWKEHGYKIVVVTNQAGVARGYYQEADVKALHAYMNELFREQGAEVDHFFYCPHHPEHGIGKYKKACHCRKPETGMLEMAERYYEVDKARSWMIGDTLNDIEAGRRYGVRTVLVGTGYGAEQRGRAEGAAALQEFAENAASASKRQSAAGKELPYDIYAETLMDAAREILARDGIAEEG